MKPTVLLQHETPRPGQPLRIRALLRVEGDPPADRNRIPLNLALVLDRSGSMSGPKLAAAREAAALAVRRLWPEDVVSVVAYDDEVRVVAEPGPGSDQRDLSGAIRSIRAGGMTNLSGGWLAGRELVERNHSPEGVHRVILMTDGLANVGITDAEVLMSLCRNGADDGITTTTIGFGERFDEDLLRSMADAGGGSSYYIEEPDQAPGVFEEELEGLLSLTAQNLTAHVRVGDAVELAAIRHSYPSSRDADGVRLTLGDLYAREPKRLLLELEVNPVPASGGPGNPGDVEIATLVLEADVLEPDGGITHRRMALPFILDVEGGARVEPEVESEVLLMDAAEARNQALERQREGDPDGARHVLGRAREKLRSAGIHDARLDEEVEDLTRMAGIMADRALSRKDVKYMKQRIHDHARSRGKAMGRIARKDEAPDSRSSRRTE